jgi:choline dehydrogenase-like flavoprotein
MDVYDTIIVGSGFASSFFLHAHLRRMPATARVLVLERGPHADHAWQVEHRSNSPVDEATTFERAGDPAKEWLFSVGFGGSSNCWWACTPRMLPNDFRMRSVYGVGRDWPVGYDELETFYCDAEEIMQISGPDDGPFPRSRPYPQPPHRFTDPDRLLKARHPRQYFNMPTARARVATDTRAACCANAVCRLCPVDAKFTVQNGMRRTYDDPRVTVRLGAQALAVETTAGVATGVRYAHQGETKLAKGSLVALGANALFNPFLLLRSGFDDPQLGRRLHEQASVDATVFLDGVDNFQGSTSITGHGYMLYDGPHRSSYAGCLIEAWNRPFFRLEPGRYRQLLRLKFVFEDLPSSDNRVQVSARDPSLPEAFFSARSDYVMAGIRELSNNLPRVLEGLPVERVELSGKIAATEAHVQGTTVMGDDPADSVVDKRLVHHKVRNLLVLGGSVFPTGAPANPTLTLSALSLYAATHL